MHSEDRLIHFSSELVHKPVTPDMTLFKRFYYELSQSPVSAYDNTDFSNPSQPKTYSGLVLLPDRLVILEEWADSTLPAFVERVGAVGRCYLEVVKAEAFHAQVVTLRAACSISHGDSAKDFVLHRLCGQPRDAMVETLGRPCDLSAVRFVFNETPDYPGTFHVSIEPFRFGPREVFIEVKAVFRNLSIDGSAMEQAQGALHDARAFLTDRLYPYLNAFDTPGVR
jgi:hypothetical protein